MKCVIIIIKKQSSRYLDLVLIIINRVQSIIIAILLYIVLRWLWFAHNQRSIVYY